MRYLKRILSTYRWVTGSSFRASYPESKKDFLSWWEFFTISSISFVASMIIGFIGAMNLNVLSPDTEWGDANPAEIAFEVGDGVGRIAQQIRTHRIGEDVFVLLLSSIAWWAIAVIVVCGFSYFYRAWGTLGGRIKRNFYEVSVLSFRASIVWLAMSAVLFAIESVVRPFVNARTYWNLMPWIFSICAVAVSVAVWIWMKLEKMGEWKYVGAQRKLAVVFVTFMPVMAMILMPIGELGIVLFPQEVQISVSRQCDPSACYVYVRTENLDQIIIDTPFDVRVDVLKIDPASKSSGELWGQAEISLTPDQHDMVPSVIDPGVEKMLRVQHVSFKCKVDKGTGSMFIPVKADGQIRVHVTNKNLAHSYAYPNVMTKGIIAPLFRLSADSCLK